MSKSSRDDFPSKTKQKLWMRVSGRCSNPDCRVQTQGPASDEDGTVNVGKAAHITAAAPGGPRYDSTLTKDQRKGFKNGIWLCAMHADLVDKDVAGHAVALLCEWKQKAEQAAKSELGEKLPSKDDAVKLLSTALTGSRQRLATSAISSVHRAVSQSLQSLDHRLQVSSSYCNGVTEYDITANQPLELQISFDTLEVPDLPSTMKELFSKGKGFEVDAKAVAVTGSPLIEHVFATTSGGKFSISAVPRPVRLEIWLQHAGQDEKLCLNHVDGSLSTGHEGISIRANCWQGLVSMHYEAPYPQSSEVGNFDIDFACGTWQGLDIQQLPYFDKLRAFVKEARGGASMHSSVEIDGLPLATFVSKQFVLSGQVEAVDALLTYTDCARTLVAVVAQKISFDLSSRPCKSATRRAAAALS